ncbi:MULTISPECIES: MCE family protein [unclassified Streptomyces]|uniref:MCE family protein n=1 Tax=unclassified Streptomyces TaxID=2593676 RepID=UPI0001C18BAF|nr:MULTISPECIES: MCE family protein [unclassified Streptomyces]AEN13654.1 virulence factor Mce family protein [Streptomyces sp. SirexAA-E]MYR70647.1 MCE family protein [Streptomyces sp. SID4939]MYR99180.1 MCE family protein [Streptomyces sp. SID4940]MYT67546.1 MCE family protein [Streptomyces sp. SID8357]MYT86390.1 MCE family protein [Streptomyces sp. SID8360]
MSRAPRRPGARATAGIAALVAACAALVLVATTVDLPSFTGIDQVPLPGGADLGDHPYEITAEFADVLSLSPQSSVKVNDVAVGRVTKISLSPGSWTAQVTMRVNGKIEMPANAYAHLEQSSLLGEKYVQLSPPADGTARGSLTDGDRIPLVRTNRNPEVEEVFGALSMLLNGGGVDQLKTITTELNKALSGQEPQIRSMLSRVDTLVTDLDDHKEDITDALDGVNRLAATLATRKQAVGTVLTDLSPGLKVLEKQRGQLLTMLRSLDTLSTVAVDTVNRSKADMIADLKALAPTLTALADSGNDLPDSLQVLLTYPFTDEVLRGVKGDYLNVYLDVTAAPGTRIIPALTPGDPTPTFPKAQQQSGTALPLPLPAVPASGTEGTH